MKGAIQLILLLGASSIILTVSGCSMANNDNENLKETLLVDPSADSADQRAKDYSPEDINKECNKTFIITMDYLKELNDTGSFPDETDKTPMCFIRCFLQKGGILTEDDKINKEQAIAVGWVKDGDSIDDCLQEMTGTPCERAYFLMRCVSIRHLVEGRSKDSKKR